MVEPKQRKTVTIYWYHPETGQRFAIGNAANDEEANLLRGAKDLEYYSKDNNHRFLPKGIILSDNLFKVRADIPIKFVNKEETSKTMNLGSFRSLREARLHKARVIKCLLSDFDSNIT